MLGEHGLAARCHAVQFSPAWGLLAPADLAAWILADRLPVRLQLQQHKYIRDGLTLVLARDPRTGDLWVSKLRANRIVRVLAPR